MPDELQNEETDAMADEEQVETGPAAAEASPSDAAPESELTMVGEDDASAEEAEFVEEADTDAEASVSEAVEASAEDGAEPEEAESDIEPEPGVPAGEEAGEETEVESGEDAPVEAVSEESGHEAEGSQPQEGAEAEEVAEEEGEEEEFEAEEPPIITPPPDDGVKRRWYAVHAHSGQEGNVQQALRIKAEQSGMKDMITNVFVPMEDVAEFKSGEKRLSKRKFFPGYVLVQLPEHPEKNADLWHLIKDTPGVTGFIGSRTEPVPLEDTEVQALVEEMRGERERPRAKVAFDIGERVKIIDGAFSNFMGNIGEINADRGKLKVLIEIFERQTSVEVEFWQVEKI